MEQDDCNLLLARIEDLANGVEKHHHVACSSFIDPAAIKKVKSLLENYKGIVYRAVGGYPEAERNIILIYPPWMDEDEIESPISVLSVQWDDRYYKIGHRDILGSVLGLGIKREKIGDIIVENHLAHVIVSRNISSYIIQNLIRIGKAPVTVSEIAAWDIELSVKKSKVIKTSISSMRLDSIASSGFGMSRNKILPLIHRGIVQVNWETVIKPDYPLKEGDIISLRGQGRIRVAEISGISKKNRLHVILEKW